MRDVAERGKQEVAPAVAPAKKEKKEMTGMQLALFAIGCLVVGWFIFGIPLGFIAVSCGWQAQKKGQWLGWIGVVGGAIWLCAGVVALFGS